MTRVCIIILAVLFLMGVAFTHASSDKMLKDGLLGAGSGLAGGLASGAKGKDVWKGALAGAGVNLLGGMLLDNHSGEEVTSESNVKNLDSTSAYKQGYQDGFENGYKQGYREGNKDGYKEGMQEGLKSR